MVRVKLKISYRHFRKLEKLHVIQLPEVFSSLMFRAKKCDSLGTLVMNSFSRFPAAFSLLRFWAPLSVDMVFNNVS